MDGNIRFVERYCEPCRSACESGLKLALRETSHASSSSILRACARSIYIDIQNGSTTQHGRMDSIVSIRRGDLSALAWNGTMRRSPRRSRLSASRSDSASTVHSTVPEILDGTASLSGLQAAGRGQGGLLAAPSAFASRFCSGVLRFV